MKKDKRLFDMLALLELFRLNADYFDIYELSEEKKIQGNKPHTSVIDDPRPEKYNENGVIRNEYLEHRRYERSVKDD